MARKKLKAAEPPVQDRYELAAEMYRKQLSKALGHLQYSMKKVARLTADPEELDEESLETWESFSSRFARVIDIFLTKYLRAKVLANDPGQSGSVRDFANQAEKIGLLEDANRWMEYRELRNIEAHTYVEDLERFLTKLRIGGGEVLKFFEKRK